MYIYVCLDGFGGCGYIIYIYIYVCVCIYMCVCVCVCVGPTWHGGPPRELHCRPDPRMFPGPYTHRHQHNTQDLQTQTLHIRLNQLFCQFLHTQNLVIEVLRH